MSSPDGMNALFLAALADPDTRAAEANLDCTVSGHYMTDNLTLEYVQ